MQSRDEGGTLRSITKLTVLLYASSRLHKLTCNLEKSTLMRRRVDLLLLEDSSRGCDGRSAGTTVRESNHCHELSHKYRRRTLIVKEAPTVSKSSGFKRHYNS
jgi:hypothetical protein